MHRQKQILGYGVMVTLQILVLSFLVRIQVAQLRAVDSSAAFFIVGERVALLPVDCWFAVLMGILGNDGDNGY